MRQRELFRDRAEAGRQLAARLRSYREQSPLVLGLPRGGIPVAYEIARALDAPLDVCVVRKIGKPGQAELGIGAVAEGGVTYIDAAAALALELTDAELETLAATQRAEVEDRVRRLRRGKAPIEVRGQTVIVVDDGLATGGTARAAMQILRARGAEKLVLAVPLGSADSLRELGGIADEIVCLHPLTHLGSVSRWYEDFEATEDDEVIALLEHAAAHRRRSERIGIAADCEVRIPLDLATAPGAVLEGHLAIPPVPQGVVLFAHGSGSNRRSPRNQAVANVLRREGFATLLFDLLTPEEATLDARTPHHRFDVELLTSRLLLATVWARSQTQLASLPLGYFGANTGAAAALAAAAARPDAVQAIVSRGGRADLAEASLGDVQAPTLLIVGGDDPDVLQLNREALYFLPGKKKLVVIPGATHLFDEPGTLDEVARETLQWFEEHLRAAGTDRATAAS